MECAYKGILALKKEILRYVTTWTNHDYFMLMKQASHEKHAIRFHLRKVVRVVKITETEGRTMSCQGLGKEEVESCLMGTEFQLCKVVRVMEMVMVTYYYLIPLDCLPKNGCGVKFDGICRTWIIELFWELGLFIATVFIFFIFT